MSRKEVSISDVINTISIRPDKNPNETIVNLYSSLALPSYVHGYSLAIEYMTKWFEKKFEKDYFVGGIYIDGKHVIDDYKKFSSKDIVKGKNPRARMLPVVDFDFDRENLDTHLSGPELLLRKSNFEESFFKDTDRNIFLGVNMRALRMNFDFKVRVSTRSQQLDLFNRMEMYFRVGSTQHDNISVDFHIPKSIILNIADKAGFEIKNGEVKDIVDFLSYLNSHSDLPFLFKIRAINQKPEFFIRVNKLYTHIAVRDKLRLDDGEQDGKLDFNFHIELAAQLTIPIPHFYTYYSAGELTQDIEIKESSKAVAVYTINVLEIPKTDENGWGIAATTDCQIDDGETFVDLSPMFEGNNPLARAVNHSLANYVSPSKFVNIKIYKDEDVARLVDIDIDWEKKICYFKSPQDEDVLHIVIYYDRQYINDLDITLNLYNENRVSNN